MTSSQSLSSKLLEFVQNSVYSKKPHHHSSAWMEVYFHKLSYQAVYFPHPILFKGRLKYNVNLNLDERSYFLAPDFQSKKSFTYCLNEQEIKQYLKILNQYESNAQKAKLLSAQDWEDFLWHGKSNPQLFFSNSSQLSLMEEAITNPSSGELFLIHSPFHLQQFSSTHQVNFINSLISTDWTQVATILKTVFLNDNVEAVVNNFKTLATFKKSFFNPQDYHATLLYNVITSLLLNKPTDWQKDFFIFLMQPQNKSSFDLFSPIFKKVYNAHYLDSMFSLAELSYVNTLFEGDLKTNLSRILKL